MCRHSTLLGKYRFLGGIRWALEEVPRLYRRLVTVGHPQGIDVSEWEPTQLFVLVPQHGLLAGRLPATVRKNQNVHARDDGVDPGVQYALRNDLESQLFGEFACETPLWRLKQLEFPARQLPFVALVTEENYFAAADDNALHGNGKWIRV